MFAQAARFEFVTYDDNVYVTENRHVQAGLTGEGLSWSLGFHECNWHPLTWWSLMLDAELFGLAPAAFHLVNVALHAASALLLFFLLARTTDAPVRSGLAALLFAIHPLHVESVAWVAERKDVLSTVFWFLTMHAYVSYARRPSQGRYAVTAGLFALGLLAKPMLVTLPLVLLVFDFWPLARQVEGWRRLIVEKIPLLSLSAVSAVLTLIAQHRGGAVGSIRDYPLGPRLANALVSVIAYLGKAVWPVRLSVYYPYPEHPQVVAALACLLVIAAVSVAAVRWARRAPALTFGWSWFLVTLLPVIGLVQVGTQAMADRYTYVPLVGPIVALCFTLPARMTPALMVVAIALGWRAHAQTAVWRDSVRLFTSALAHDKDNVVAHSNLGRVYLDRSQIDLAALHAREVVRLDPDAADGHFNLGVVLERQGRLEEAMQAYRDAIRIAPGEAPQRVNLGILLAGEGKAGEAETQFAEAVRCDPESFVARNNLGTLLAQRGALDEAIAQFAEAVRLEPDNAGAATNLENARRAKAAMSPAPIMPPAN